MTSIGLYPWITERLNLIAITPESIKIRSVENDIRLYRVFIESKWRYNCDALLYLACISQHIFFESNFSENLYSIYNINYRSSVKFPSKRAFCNATLVTLLTWDSQRRTISVAAAVWRFRHDFTARGGTLGPRDILRAARANAATRRADETTVINKKCLSIWDTLCARRNFFRDHALFIGLVSRT